MATVVNCSSKNGIFQRESSYMSFQKKPFQVEPYKNTKIKLDSLPFGFLSKNSALEVWEKARKPKKGKLKINDV